MPTMMRFLRKYWLLLTAIVLIVAAVVALSIPYLNHAAAFKGYAEIAESASPALPAAGELVADNLASATIDIDWTQLKEQCPDVVGWLLIPGTHINYPIAQGSDNDYYLTHMPDGSYSSVGSVFLDAQSRPGLDGVANLIYGHYAQDDLVFSDLLLFGDGDFFNAHPTVYIITPERTLELDVVALAHFPADAKIRKFVFEDAEAFRQYVEMLLGQAVLIRPGAADGMENVYCLPTCSGLGSVERTVLVATLRTADVGGI
jgi:sortase B